MNSSKKDCKLKKEGTIFGIKRFWERAIQKNEEKRVLNDLKETEIYTKKNLSTMNLCGKK